MTAEKLPEVWLRGPLNNISPHLQPVAHALLQAREEVNTLMINFPGELLWQQPAGMASPGFHLQHLTGVLDRLFTYAQNKQLNETQLNYLAAEGKADQTADTWQQMVSNFNEQVNTAMAQLQSTGPAALTATRGVGRARVPSTIIGLYIHAAEHTMRHLGQLLVTVAVLKAS